MEYNNIETRNNFPDGSEVHLFGIENEVITRVNPADVINEFNGSYFVYRHPLISEFKVIYALNSLLTGGRERDFVFYAISEIMFGDEFSVDFPIGQGDVAIGSDKIVVRDQSIAPKIKEGRLTTGIDVQVAMPLWRDFAKSNFPKKSIMGCLKDGVERPIDFFLS